MGSIRGTGKSILLCFASLLVSCHIAPASAGGRGLLKSKPDPEDAPTTARWLVAENSWGVISTISIDLGGAPFAKVVSYSDGVAGQGTGIPYFYLTEMDPTARNALKDARATFTVSEIPLGFCDKMDAQNPNCAKLTLNGKLKLLDAESSEEELALKFLFAKHPEMKGWPKGHDFQIFKLLIDSLFLLDMFGGARPLTPEEYFKPVNKA